jgi:chromosome segregation ATPase
MFNSKKIQGLLEENEELKTKFQAIHNQEDNIKNLTEVLKKLRLEVARLNEERRSLKDSIEKNRIEGAKRELEIDELNQRIGYLHEMKDELQNVILSYTNQIDNIESTLKENHERISAQSAEENEHNEVENINSELIDKKEEIEQYISDANQIKNKIIDEEAKLADREELISEEVNQLNEKLLELQESYSEIEARVNKGNETIRLLKLEENRLKTELEKKQAEISAIEMNLLKLKEEEKILLSKIGGMAEHEGLLSGRIGNLQSEVNSKINNVREIDSIISEKTEIKDSLDREHLILMNDLNEKRRLLTQFQAEYNKLFEDTKTRKKELFDTEQTLKIKAQKLSNINIELMGYDKKYSSLKNEITELETFRNDLLRNIQKDRDAAEKFADQNRKLTELVPLLEKRKQEIEQGNSDLEGRFTIMFQKFNHELNQINRKRSILEQIVLKKEKDVDEKDQLLFEKIAALEESERVLNMRQVELESLEKQIAGLSEHKEIFRTDLIKMEQEALERKNYQTDIRLETELLLQKKNAVEKNLQELLLFMNESFERTKGRNSKFENELSYYEDQIQAYRTKIADSLKELNDIKTSVGSLKIEQEEYKSNISRLSALKKKLHEELTKHQTILQRYQKMREKLQIEPTTGKSFEDTPPKGKIGQPKEVKNPLIYKI